MDQDAEKDARNALARIETHEEVCAVRYEGINARLRRLEGILLSAAAGIIGLMVTIIVQLSDRV